MFFVSSLSLLGEPLGLRCILPVYLGVLFWHLLFIYILFDITYKKKKKKRKEKS